MHSNTGLSPTVGRVRSRQVIDDPQLGEFYILQEFVDMGALLPEEVNTDPIPEPRSWGIIRDVILGGWVLRWVARCLQLGVVLPSYPIMRLQQCHGAAQVWTTCTPI